MAGAEQTNQTTPELRIGSYRLLERLGSGGMSSVLRGVHIDTGLEVAVKVLPRYLAKNPVLLQRFLREAKSAEALEHPSIVAIYDRGFDQGRYYLVLEFVAGGDLHDRVRSRGPLDVAEAIAIIRDVAAGLRYAAGRGLIHRDIKPANLLLTLDGRVKITDLGLALQVEDDDERVTRDGTTVGTVDYMAPEQARDSRATSVRSDIYSLGCTFYYLLTGSPPFAGGDVVEKLRRHIIEPPPDVRLARPEVPAPLALLIQKMMAKKADKRFADYDQLIAALDATGAAGGREPLVAESDSLPALMPIDDEAPLRPPAPRPPSSQPSAPASVFEINDTSLVELAPIEDDSHPWRRPGSSTVPRPSSSTVSRPGSSQLRPPSDRAIKAKKPLQVFDESTVTRPALDDDDSESRDSPEAVVLPPRRRPNTRLWIVRGLVAGLLVVLLAVAVSVFRSIVQLTSQQPTVSAQAHRRPHHPAHRSGVKHRGPGRSSAPAPQAPASTGG